MAFFPEFQFLSRYKDILVINQASGQDGWILAKFILLLIITITKFSNLIGYQLS